MSLLFFSSFRVAVGSPFVLAGKKNPCRDPVVQITVSPITFFLKVLGSLMVYLLFILVV